MAGEQSRTPVSLNHTTYEPINNPICAGDKVEFKVNAEFDEDTLFQIKRVLVDLTTGLTVLSDPGFPPFSIRRSGESFDNFLLSYPTKIDLAPGPYEYRVAIEKSGSEALFFFVPFEIKECNG